MLLQANLSRGPCPIEVVGDASDERPTVLLFMDAFGPRPALLDIAERIAAGGRRVLIPDLFYAHLPYRPLDPASLFSGGDDRQRLHVMTAGLDQPRLDEDVGALLDFTAQRFGTDKGLAAIGYCLGGRYALTAATLGRPVRFAASIHGSQLAPANGGGALGRFGDVAATIYIGIAERDPTFDAAEEGRLAEALRAAGVAHLIESYAGAAHGFALADLPVYDPAAFARHLRRIEEGLADAFD